MGKPLVEEWRAMPVKNFEKTHQISNYGRIKSVIRQQHRSNGRQNYVVMVGGTVLKTRTNVVDPHRYVTLNYTDKGINFKKTVYPHKVCALAFKNLPRDLKADKVIVKNGNHEDIWPDNLAWVSQSYLSKKQMTEAPDERRNWMGNYNKKKRLANIDKINEMRKLVKEGKSVTEASISVGQSATWGYNNLI